MDNHTNIDLRKLLASAALEDEKLAEELRNEGIDKFTLQKRMESTDKAIFIKTPAMSISKKDHIGKMKLN